MNLRRLPVIAAILLAPVVARAEPHAEYVTPENAPKDGIPHVLDVSLLGQYARVTDDHPAGLKNLGSFVTRTRLALGRSITYCAGLDTEVGGCPAAAVGAEDGVHVAAGRAHVGAHVLHQPQQRHLPHQSARLPTEQHALPVAQTKIFQSHKSVLISEVATIIACAHNCVLSSV